MLNAVLWQRAPRPPTPELGGEMGREARALVMKGVLSSPLPSYGGFGVSPNVSFALALPPVVENVAGALWEIRVEGG